MEDILPYIRFPTMSMHDIGTKVKSAGLLSDEQILALFEYLGKKNCGQNPKLADCLKFESKERKGRQPPVWFRWDKEKKHNSLQLSKNCLVVKSDTTSYYQPILGNYVMSKGTFVWELVLKTVYQGSYACCIGVVPANITGWTNSYMIGYSGHLNGWAYSVGHAQKYNYQMSSYGSICASGDVVKVRLDCDKKTIEFFRNGKSLGVAFSNVEPPVRAALSLYGTNHVILQFPRDV